MASLWETREGLEEECPQRVTMLALATAVALQSGQLPFSAQWNIE